MEGTNKAPNGGTKKTKGKQKIEIKKIESYAARMTTFSKRKSGIFKKLYELISLTAAQVIFVVFSETGKPYTFTNTKDSADVIINHYLDQNVIHPNNLMMDGTRQARINAQEKQYNGQRDTMENEMGWKNRFKMMESGRASEWWEKPVVGLDLEESKELLKALEADHEAFLKQCKEIDDNVAAAAAAATADFPPYGFYYGGSNKDNFK